MVVHRGLRSVYEEAAKRLEEGRLGDGSALDADQRAFFRSIMITIEGIRQMAENLAVEAESLAAKPGGRDWRRAELLESAAACRHVPFEPARTYLEGLPAVWPVLVAP